MPSLGISQVIEITSNVIFCLISGNRYFASLNIEELNLLVKDYASDGYLLVNQFC